MSDLSTAIDNLAAEDPSELPVELLTEQLIELVFGPDVEFSFDAFAVCVQ